MENQRARAIELAKAQGCIGPVYFISDAWGGYWQCAVNGRPYNFRIDG